jgi:hypothetical protein
MATVEIFQLIFLVIVIGGGLIGFLKAATSDDKEDKNN